MKKIIITLIILTLASSYVFAQNDNDKSFLAVSLGAAVNYYYGPADRNFNEFENDRVNWQINSMIGFKLAQSKSGKRTLLAAFGNYGFNNQQTIKKIIADQGYTSLATSQGSANNFYQLEGGLLLADMIRLTTGVGSQYFNEQTLVGSNGIRSSKKHFQYNSSTIGFRFNFGNVAWIIDCNIASGQDLEKTIITPSTGLSFNF